MLWIQKTCLKITNDHCLALNVYYLTIVGSTLSQDGYVHACSYNLYAVWGSTAIYA